MNYLADLARQVRDEVPADIVPPDADDLFLIYAVLVTARGTATTAAHVHDAWTAWMLMDHHEHPSMRPFELLAPDVRDQDEPFAAAIRRVAARREADAT